MKSYNIIILLLVLSSVRVVGQTTDSLIYPEFTNMDPLWEYHFEDYNAPTDSFAERYYEHLPYYLISEEHFTYIYLFSWANGDLFEINGGHLLKIDNETGEEVCRASFNEHTGLELFENYNRIENKEDELLLFGTQQIDTSINLGVFGWSDTWSEPYRYKIRKINKENCAMTEIIDLTDSIGANGNYPRSAKYTGTTELDRYLAMHPYTYYDAHYRFTDLDSDLSIDSSTHRSVFYIDNDPNVYDLFNYVMKVDTHRLLAYVYQRHRDSLGGHPHMASIVNLDISDPDDIHIADVLDITEMVYDALPPNFRELRTFDSDDGAYVFTDFYYYDFGDFRRWFLWFDENDNLLENFTELSIDGHQYQDVRGLYIGQDSCVLFTYPSLSGHPGWDIVSLDRSGHVELKAELLHQEDIEVLAYRIAVIQGDKFILASNPNRKNLSVYAFDIKDIGLDNSVSTTDPKPFHAPAQRFVSYPSPATEVVSFDLPAVTGGLDLHVINSVGKRIRDTRLDGTDSIHQMEVKDLATGLYYIRLVDEYGKIYRSTFYKQ